MLACFFFFSFLFGIKEVFPAKRCPSLISSRHGTVSCRWKNQSVSCGSELPPGSVAELTCQEFYRLPRKQRGFLECRSNGSWSLPVPQCVPGSVSDCGKRSGSVKLIVNGEATSRGAFPWHVAIYNLIDGSYQYWCGGSLISEVAVITAAHCAWEIPPEKLMLIFGKYYREFKVIEKSIQKIKGRKIVVPNSYQDVAGNYNGDIAVIFLERPVILGHYSIPVCIDWDQRLQDEHLVEGSSGAVLGWGLTENDALAEPLRMTKLPVVSDERCIAEQEQDFKKFITYSTFCAGFGNGTAVCNGDSGGGLSFFDKISGRWYLQGVVSVSPRKNGTPYCDPNSYAIFTKVGVFSKWLESVKKLETESSVTESHATEKDGENIYQFLRNCFRLKKHADKRKEVAKSCPHTAAMLNLVQYLSRRKSVSAGVLSEPEELF